MAIARPRGDRAGRAPRGDRPDRDPELRAKYIKGRGEGGERRAARSEFAVRQARRAQGAARGEQQGAALRAPGLDRQRIDKWLWHARVVRTRAAAAALAAAGHVRINGQRIDAASRAGAAGRRRDGGARPYGAGAQGRGFRRAPRVRGGGPRRSVRICSPPAPAGGRLSRRASGAGRPTKRSARASERFTGETCRLRTVRAAQPLLGRGPCASQPGARRVRK